MNHVTCGGADIPKLGLGTWQNTGPTCRETVRDALELGYRHIDTAEAYENEQAVGEGIAAADVDREDLFVTTKVWRSNLRDGDLRTSVRDSLERLGLDYVDTVLIHWPHPRVPAAEPLAALADLRSEGVLEHIGVSNFTRSQLEEAIEVCEAPVVADQVLYHPYRDQSRLRSFCQEQDVALTAYSPLARGDAVDDDLLRRIGERHDRTAAQVALRWLVQQRNVVAIPKSTSREHLADNLAVFDFSLSETEMERIDGHTGGLRTVLRSRLPSLVRHFPV
jgi:diketogulonate reductase-like aldo/keto reductase